jgi:rhodanese-related sulfurtransferase
MKKNWLSTAVEIALIIVIPTLIGIVWNRTLLTSAWRGEVTSQAEAVPAAAQSAEALPMPVGLMQVKELVDAKQAVLVDARSGSNFAEGHIAGALSLPVDQARQNPARPLKSGIPADATIITYCNGFSCHDSMEVAKILTKAGFASVYVFEGGFPEWRDAGSPVAKGGS